MASSSKTIAILQSVLLFIRLRIVQAALPVFLLFCMPAAGTAQYVHKHKDSPSAQKQEQERPVADSHSFMELFTKLEDEWTKAIQKKDRSGLDALLAPEFIVRSAEDPQRPLLRDAWISEAITAPQPQSLSRSAMAIRAFMGVAVVSFTQDEQQNMNGKDRTVRCFVVDVWEVNHQHWLVAERYILPVDNIAVNHAENRLP